MDRKSTRNPRKFEPHGNYQPYGISTATNHHLPNYIQNMPLAYGYDRLELVAQMDVNIDSGQPNDIDKMLQYVQQNWSLFLFQKHDG